MRLFDPLTKILPITQIELIPNGRPTIPATPHPTDPAVLNREFPRGKRIEFGSGVRDMRASTIFAA